MTATMHTPQFTEAAKAAPVSCRYLTVNDGSRLESARTLAERCAR
jgi:hypothetical protein